MIRDAVEAVIADRNAQSCDKQVLDAAEQVLARIAQSWMAVAPPQAWIRRAAAELLRDTAWIRPAAPGCNCVATGGQGLVPTASREHADDCPAGPAGITDRQLLADVRRWARANGWSLSWGGWVNHRYDSDADIAVDWDDVELRIKRKETYPGGTGRYWPSRFTDYPVTSVVQAVDILVALDVLPHRFSSAYRAAVTS
ncbi:hypothetical protein AB0C02_27910 [Micromonospora sp. NPDC048999]|uniref:hypothetical protein n=1 Tax=Micromonospora sp. NPDC048999 TaxID=3155391 RepID=UPI00340D6C2B